ncbi:hypothetical protein BJX63DRAFT_396286 [Aspergillus granulosus]|uniref:Uncharacterized protein n=1 Tax=Aspergillus granulosus TaxID=176169 RepID=A0ABR4HBF9_9EURO
MPLGKNRPTIEPHRQYGIDPAPCEVFPRFPPCLFGAVADWLSATLWCDLPRKREQVALRSDRIMHINRPVLGLLEVAEDTNHCLSDRGYCRCAKWSIASLAQSRVLGYEVDLESHGQTVVEEAPLRVRVKKKSVVSLVAFGGALGSKAGEALQPWGFQCRQQTQGISRFTMAATTTSIRGI